MEIHQQLQNCPTCNKAIQKQRLSLHLHMCSTIKLRQSQVLHNANDNIGKNCNMAMPIGVNHNNIQCVFCRQGIHSSYLQQHVKVCEKRIVECQYCKNKISIRQKNQHIRLCPCNTEKDYVNNQNKRNSGLMESFKRGMNLFEKFITTQGNKLSNRCNRYIRQSNGPTIEALRKIKDELQQKLGDIYSQIAYTPGARPMPRKAIEQIQQAQYISNNQNKQQICTICYCQFQNQQTIKILKCRHIFHPQCVNKWMKVNSRCPVCKADQLNSK